MTAIHNVTIRKDHKTIPAGTITERPSTHLHDIPTGEPITMYDARSPYRDSASPIPFYTKASAEYWLQTAALVSA